MLNRCGVTKTTLTATKQILANVELQASVGCIVSEDLGVDVGGRKIVKAGTPILVNFANLQAEATAPIPAQPGVFKLRYNTTMPDTCDVTFTKLNTHKTESYSCPNGGVVSGNIEQQVTSLVNAINGNENSWYTAAVEAEDVSGTTAYYLILTQKQPDVNEDTVVYGCNGPDIFSYTETLTPPAATVPGNAVLLHDVDVTNGKANGTALYLGVVNVNRLDADVKAKVECGVNTVGAVSFISV